jgi:hypothetical protein
VALVRTDFSAEYRLHDQGGKNQGAMNNVSSNLQIVTSNLQQLETCN